MNRGARREHPAIRTRDRILYLLKENGPSDAISLSRRLHLSTMAVRQHLYSLHNAGLVNCMDESRPVGRPVKLWTLLPAADRFFPDRHQELVTELLDAARRSFGDTGFRSMMESRAVMLRRNLRGKIPAGAALERRLEALVLQREREGYLAEIQRREDGAFVFIEKHCPIRGAASFCPALCDTEIQCMKAVLGPGVNVKRVEHFLDGAHRCVYHICRS